MGARVRPEAARRTLWRPDRQGLQRTGLLVLEHLAIAGGYLLFAWLGHHLMREGQQTLFWPAGGFALAVLLLRGASRWPAILLGALLVSENWIFRMDVDPFQGHASALLAATARALSAAAGAGLLRRRAETARWPHTLRGVMEFLLIAGLAYPLLGSGMTYGALLVSQSAAVAPLSLRELGIWFAANSTGVLAVTPAILAFSVPSMAFAHHSRWEGRLLGGLLLVTALLSFEIERRFELRDVLLYPTLPLVIWATLRFGSRGTALSNVVWVGIVLAFASTDSAEARPVQTFLQLQARIVVLASGFLVLAAAIEERHQLHQSLEEQRHHLERRVSERTREFARLLSLLHSSLESTADGLLVVDRQGHITAMNRRMAELWGIPSSILESGDDERALAFARAQVKDPESFASRVEYLYEHPEQESEDELELKDGRIFERVSMPQRLGNEIIGRVWSFRDMTLRRRAEQERDRLLIEECRARKAAELSFHEAQAALGLRDEFLTVAAHELRTPLTSMKAQIQHLERLLDGNVLGHVEVSRVRRVVAATSRQLRRFQDLGDQLLDITRLTLGKLQLKYELLDFREVLDEQLEHYAESAAKAGSALRLECVGSLPGEWDRLRLEQILSSLLSNAIRFGSGRPITVRLEAPLGRARVQIIDQGIGIAREDQERIFERLERGVDSRHYGGLGLGLWIARQSVEALGGRLWVQSTLGQGAVFTAELPCTRQPRSPQALPAPHAPC
jgi:signal transduction histidine kinase/integral membrane sensor domain MASE1